MEDGLAVLPFIQSQIIHLVCADDEAVSDEDYSAPCLSARVREEGAGHAEPHSRCLNVGGVHTLAMT